MRLNRLRLVNYRRFADASIEFPDGLIGIVGRNGAGKSSLIESVLWALFGHEAARTHKELLKRQGAAPGDDVVVRLEFEIEGAQHAVTRRLRGRSLQPEAAVESTGTLVVAPGPNSWEQANLLITRILGFDRASFESTVVAKQGELAALSELRPAQRKKVLLGLLGIDRIDEAVQHARSDGRLLEARLTEARRALVDEDALRIELAATEEELRTAKAALEKATADQENGHRRLGAAQIVADEQLGRKMKDQELRVRLQGLQSRLESVWGQRTRLTAEAHLAKERLAQAPELRARLETLAGIDDDFIAYEQKRHIATKRSDLLSRRQQTAAELRELVSKEAPAAEGTETDTRSRMQSMEAELEDLATQQGRLEAERAELSARIAEPRPKALDHSPEWSSDDCCPTCGRELADTADRLRHQFQEALATWDATREEQKVKLASVKKRLSAVAERRRSLTSARAETEKALSQVRQAHAAHAARRAQMERSLADIDIALAAIPEIHVDASEHGRLVVARAERDRLRETITRLEESERRLSRIQDEDRLLAAQEQEVVRERETASRDLRAIGYEPGSWEKAQREAESLRQRVEAAVRDVIQWRERAEARARQQARIVETLAKLETRRKELRELEEGLRLLDLLVARRGEDGILPEFRSHLIGRLRPALSRAAGQLLGQMTQGRYPDLVLDEEYSASLFDNGVCHPLERFSGGEVDVCNLALRLAVSELVANARGRNRLQFVALDEVLGSQDEERRGLILNALNTLANVFRQVLVVTHTEDVRERLEHVVRVIDTGDGTSRFVTTWDDDRPPEPRLAVEEPAPLVATARA